jgi:hypothetical protein
MVFKTSNIIFMIKNYNVYLFDWADTNSMFKLRHLMFPRAWLVRLTSCMDGSFENLN